jgi:hypothetical protein
MGFSYNVNVLNQKGSPALYTDTFANRPAFGYAGRLFIANDTSAIYEDTGTAWVLIANVSSGAGTLQQVTTNGNTSNVGISVTAGGISTNSLTDTALTLGSVLFSGAGGLVTQDNTQLFWDDTNNRLGINTNTPGNSLDVHTSGTNPTLALNNTAGNQSAISFLNTAVAKWRIGNTSTNTFDIFNFVLSSIALQIKANNNAVFISSVQADEFNVQPTGYTSLASLSRNLTGAGYGVLTLKNSANGNIQATTLTVDRTYTLPDATGTIALTSNLSAYLPLSGGTLSGILISSVTSNYFLSAVSATTSEIFARIGNSASFMSIGCDSSVGGNIVTNSSPYAAVFSQFYNKPMQFATNNVVVQTITGSGNVLIGSTTDDTVNKLQVTGNAIVSKITSLENSFTTIASGATVTLFTVAASQMYLCYVTQGATSVQVTFTVSVAEGSGTAIIGVLSTSGATLVISASGLNVQATNGAAPIITAKTTYIRIK